MRKTLNYIHDEVTRKGLSMWHGVHTDVTSPVWEIDPVIDNHKDFIWRQ